MADLVPSTRLVSAPFNDRQSKHWPVERSKKISVIVTDTNNTITSSEKVYLNGRLAEIFTAAPPIPTDANFTVGLVDEDGVVVFTSGNIADNSNVITNVISSNVYLVGNYSVKISFTTVLSGNTAAFDVYFKMFTP